MIVLNFQEIVVAVLGSSLLASILGNLLVQFYRIRADIKQRVRAQMEERFFNMLTLIKAFRQSTLDPKGIDEFYDAYRHIWLYAPDDVIRSINNFFRRIGAEKQEITDADKTAAEMVLAMRKAYYGKTKLKSEDFLIITPRKD